MKSEGFRDERGSRPILETVNIEAEVIEAGLGEAVGSLGRIRESRMDVPSSVRSGCRGCRSDETSFSFPSLSTRTSGPRGIVGNSLMHLNQLIIFRQMYSNIFTPALIISFATLCAPGSLNQTSRIIHTKGSSKIHFLFIYLFTDSQ